MASDENKENEFLITLNNKNSSNLQFTTIYLVRHGQTIGNASRIYLDPSKEILSPKGRLQAFAVGKHLASVKFDRAYASSLIRAKDTAKIILEHSKCPVKQPIRFDERIREVVRNLNNHLYSCLKYVLMYLIFIYNL